MFKTESTIFDSQEKKHLKKKLLKKEETQVATLKNVSKVKICQLSKVLNHQTERDNTICTNQLSK